jgi:hypothetical protein
VDAVASTQHSRQQGSATSDALDFLFQNFLLPLLHGLPTYTEMEDPTPIFAQAGVDFRQCVQHRLQDGTAGCAVCSRKLPLLTKDGGAALPMAKAAAADPTRVPWHETPTISIPNKHLLSSNLTTENDFLCPAVRQQQQGHKLKVA